MYIALTLILGTAFIFAAAFLPKVFIERRSQRDREEAVDEFRSTLPVEEPTVPLDPEEVDLDAKWNTYWSNSRAAENALRADLNDYVGWAAALEDRFALQCEQIIKQFTVDAIILQAESASKKGGWKSDVDRRSDQIIQRVDGNISTLNHELKVEVAECTDTQWSKEDARMLTEMLSAEEVSNV